MKWVSLVEVLIVNAVLVALLVAITENYGLRNAYWGPEGFTPSTIRYPFFFITSAVNGSTRIPGLLSVDWQQVVLFLLVVTDVIFARGLLRSGAAGRPQGPVTTSA